MVKRIQQLTVDERRLGRAEAFEWLAQEFRQCALLEDLADLLQALAEEERGWAVEGENETSRDGNAL